MYKLSYTLVDHEDGNPPSMEAKYIKTPNVFAALMAARDHLSGWTIEDTDLDPDILEGIGPNEQNVSLLYTDSEEPLPHWMAEDVELTRVESMTVEVEVPWDGFESPDAAAKAIEVAQAKLLKPNNFLAVKHPDATKESVVAALDPDGPEL